MIDRASCIARDREDPLRQHKALFHIPEGLIYLDGNSLGIMPKAVPARLQEVVAKEQSLGIRPHAQGRLP